MKALVIDDAPDTRLYVRALLQRWGYDTTEAREGVEGFEAIKGSDVRIVVCDWMMPGMSGLDLCRALREEPLDRYVYVILLTGRSGREDLLHGLNAGADDFLSKPLDAEVLRARLRVAERILALEDRLAHQNQELRDSRNALRQAYDQIQADITTAARVQQQMLPVSDAVLRPVRADWLFLPAATLSGDGFNFFDLGDDLVGFYLLDVSGHGIPSALLSTSLSRSLLPGGAPGVMAQSGFLEPARFLADLNNQLTDADGEVDNYATVVYGTLDKVSGQAQVAIAGHPCPMIVHRDGSVDYLEPGGIPVGMFPEVEYETQRFRLEPGERLVVYSDGITECENADGEFFGDDRLRAIVQDAVRSGQARVTDVLGEALGGWRGEAEFQDDISILVIERVCSGGHK